MTTQKPLLSVVIPTYNHAALLRLALDRLAAQTLSRKAFEIVAVDDGSTDETPAVLAAARAPLRAVRLEVNRGRAAARNAGIRAARSPLVVFIDSDVLVGPDFLQRHLEIHRAAGRPVVGRGPVIFIPSPDVPAHVPLVRSSPAYLDTANASVPRQPLFDAGLFDEGFRVYGWEDFDLGLRLQALGLPRVFSEAAVAFHVQPPPTLESLDQDLAREEERARTALYLLRKHPGPQTRMLIQDTPLQRAVHFVMGGAGLMPVRTALGLARWLRARRLHTLAFLIARGVLNRHYLRSLDRFRRLQGHV
ncbi:MAG: glycosyltransferase [Armatimonadetes bacterium]|nr:glycosyltransferase [Armatimonadota bacterium]